VGFRPRVIFSNPNFDCAKESLWAAGVQKTTLLLLTRPSPINSSAQ
jgi:hypothetical protein